MSQRLRTRLLPAVVLMAFIFSIDNAFPDDLILAYSGPETLVCPPNGYKPKPGPSECPPLNDRLVHSWIDAGKLTPRLSESRIAPTDPNTTQTVHLPSETVAYLRRYQQDGVGQLGASKRSAVLLVVRWTVEEPRTLTIRRERQGEKPSASYSKKVKAARENYYHANISDINPESEVIWTIRSNGREYKIQFVPGL